MTIHKEGYKTIAIGMLAFALINLPSFYFISSHLLWLSLAIFILSLGLLLFLISFFRVPNRKLTIGDNLVVCPADGKVVVIEEVIDELGARGFTVQASRSPHTIPDRIWIILDRKNSNGRSTACEPSSI